MSRVQPGITIDSEVLGKSKRRAIERGFENYSRYVESLMLADIEKGEYRDLM
jgi:hypothetical protein